MKTTVVKNWQFPILIEQDEDGFFAYCPKLEGCYAQGETYEEALKNIEDAIELHLKDRADVDEDFTAKVHFSLFSVSPKDEITAN